jgi:plastocyanin
MPLTIQQGQTGTLTFAPDRVGVDPATVQSVSWQPQGSQQHVRFVAPDQVEGVSPGVGSYKVSVTMTTPGEKLTWPFDVTCTPPGGLPPEGVVPVVIFIPVPAP